MDEDECRFINIYDHLQKNDVKIVNFGILKIKKKKQRIKKNPKPKIEF